MEDYKPIESIFAHNHNPKPCQCLRMKIINALKIYHRKDYGNTDSEAINILKFTKSEYKEANLYNNTIILNMLWVINFSIHSTFSTELSQNYNPKVYIPFFAKQYYNFDSNITLIILYVLDILGFIDHSCTLLFPWITAKGATLLKQYDSSNKIKVMVYSWMNRNMDKIILKN